MQWEACGVIMLLLYPRKINHGEKVGTFSLLYYPTWVVRVRREVTPSVTRAGVPSGGIQKLGFKLQAILIWLKICSHSKNRFWVLQMMIPDPGHDDNQHRGDVSGEEKVALVMRSVFNLLQTLGLKSLIQYNLLKVIMIYLFLHHLKWLCHFILVLALKSPTEAHL